MIIKRNRRSSRGKCSAVRKGLAALLLLTLFSGNLRETSLAAQVPDMENEGYEYRLEGSVSRGISPVGLWEGQAVSLTLSLQRSYEAEEITGQPGPGSEIATPSSLSRPIYAAATPANLATPSNLSRQVDAAPDSADVATPSNLSRRNYSVATPGNLTRITKRTSEDYEEEEEDEMEIDSGVFRAGVDRMFILLKNGTFRELAAGEAEFILPEDGPAFYVSDDPYAEHMSYLPAEDSEPESVHAFYAEFPAGEEEFEEEITVQVLFHLDKEAELLLPEEEQVDPNGEIRVVSWFEDRTGSGDTRASRKNYRSVTAQSHRDISLGINLESEDKENLGRYLLRAETVIPLRNQPSFELPMTGGMGLLRFWSLSMGLFAGALWLLGRRNRRRWS